MTAMLMVSGFFGFQIGTQIGTKSLVRDLVPIALAQETATSTPPTATSTPSTNATTTPPVANPPVQAVVPQVYPDSEVPVILPRSTWDNSPDLNSLLTWMPQNDNFPSDWQPVERIVIHHSATPNDDSISAIARIQSIYRFHSVTRGWGDIGYNYIIDQQGKIYEGRYGGNGSRAAHVFKDSNGDNFNFGTIGIVLLGTYSDQDITPQMYDSVERLTGWLAAMNGLDPQATKTSAIWNNNTNNFTSTFTGYVVLRHKDIESTDCPGIVDINKIRAQAAVFRQKYQNYIYQVAGDNRIYKADKGVRKVYNSLADYANSGNSSYSKVALISQSQINLFSENRFYKFPNGSLIKSIESPKVYLVDSGKTRGMEMSAAQFEKLGFSFDAVRIIPKDDLDLYALGPVVHYAPDVSVFKKKSDSKIYVGDNGKKRYLGSAALFNFLGYSWNKIKTLSDAEVDGFLAGAPIFYPDGALIKFDKLPDVYFIANGQLHKVLSAGIFASLKFKWKDVKTLPQSESASFAMAQPVKHANGTLIKPDNSSNIYVIQNGNKTLIKSAAEFNASGYKWSNIITLGAADFNALYPDTAVDSNNQSNSNNSSGSSNPNSSGNPLVRVSLAEAPANADIIISANGPYKYCDISNNCQTRTGQTDIPYSASVYAKFIPDSAATILRVDSYTDWNWNKSANYNQFRGNIEIKYSSKSKKLWIVNELPLEDYLKGIGEVSNSDEYGHIQALIVAARTYAYNYIKLGGKFGSDEIFALDNTPSSQLYKGYGRESLAPNVVKAVGETRGEIITYNGQPIVAAYSSGAPETHNTGTRSACSVWGGKYCQPGYEYLSGGVKDPDIAPYTQSVCGGANHCVGLSAAGSRQLAKLGKTYKEILIYYYKGTLINKVY